MARAFGVIIALVLLAAIVYLSYRAWLWSLAVLAPFVIQWWWLALAAGIFLGWLQARSWLWLYEANFSNLGGNKPVLPEELVVGSEAETMLLMKLGHEKQEKQEMQQYAEQRKHELRAAGDLRIADSGRADGRYKNADDYNNWIDIDEASQEREEQIDEAIASIFRTREKRREIWQTNWMLYGLIRGISHGSAIGGILGLALYVYLLFWANGGYWSVLGSGVVFVLGVVVTASLESSKFRELAKREITRFEEGIAADAAKLIAEEDPIPSELPRIGP